MCEPGEQKTRSMKFSFKRDICARFPHRNFLTRLILIFKLSVIPSVYENVKLTGKKLNIEIVIFKHLSILPKNLLIQTANTFQNKNNSFRKYFLNRIPIKILDFPNKYNQNKLTKLPSLNKINIIFPAKMSSKWGEGQRSSELRPVSQLQNWSKSPFPPTTTITGRVYREQDSLPRARLLFKGTRGEEGEGKKRGIRNRRFLCLPRNALFVAPGEGMFNFSHANPMIHPRETPLVPCSKFSSQWRRNTAPSSAISLLRCQKACEG